MQNNINSEEIQSLNIPLPKQNEIFEKVQKKLSIIDHIETLVNREESALVKLIRDSLINN